MAMTDRVTTLSNGETVPLLTAARWFALLGSHQELPDLEWDAVYHLREVCLGRPLEPEQTRTLVHEGLLTPDGRVDPVLRAVVLAGVRGEGRVLHLDSPFTNPLDRAVADFVRAHDYLAAHLPPVEAEELFRDDLGTVVKRAVESTPLPPGLGSGHLVREILRRSNQGDPGRPPNPAGDGPTPS